VEAKTALEALPVVWDEARMPRYPAPTSPMCSGGLTRPGLRRNQAGGDVKAALAGAAKKVEAVYSYPFQNHACMSDERDRALDSGALRDVGPDAERRRRLRPGARGLGSYFRQGRRAHVMLGGGFGRRGTYPDDYVGQAVLICQADARTPVKLIWSRERTLAHGKYHPVMQCKLAGA